MDRHLDTRAYDFIGWSFMLVSLEKLNACSFAEQLNTLFNLHIDPATPIALKLVEVKENDPSPRIELFALHFRGPSSPHLPQGIYRMDHAKMGTLEIFITAIAAEPDGILYESVFHRFRNPTV
jgi:hypothetical protein